MSEHHEIIVKRFKESFLRLTKENRAKQVALMESRTINTNEEERKIGQDILKWAKQNINQ